MTKESHIAERLKMELLGELRYGPPLTCGRLGNQSIGQNPIWSNWLNVNRARWPLL